MRSSKLPLIYFILFLATSSFIVSASLFNPENNQNNYDNICTELEALYAENDAFLADQMSVMNFPKNYLHMNQSEEESSTLKPVVRSYVRSKNPTASIKTNYEIADLEVRKSLYKLFLIQVPNEKFDLRNFDIEGWPEGVDRLKPHWTSTEVIRIRQNLRNFKFNPIPRFTFEKQHCSDVSDVDFSHDPNLKYSEVFEILKQRYRIESKHTDAIRIDWTRLDRSKVPPKYDSVLINGKVMMLAKYFKCPEIVDNIHFHPLNDLELSRKTSKKQGAKLDSTLQRNNHKMCVSKDLEIRDSLYKPFHIQMPNMKFDLRNFDIEGWPEGVDRLRPVWNSTEIFTIRQNFSKFKFIPISRVTFAKQHGFDASDLNFDYDPNLKYSEVFERLKKRYRIESKHTDADRIGWKQLDRSKIPPKYDSVPINGKVMMLAKFFRCPEIVDNIHFHPLSDYELFCKSFTKGTKHHCVISKYIKIQVAQGIFPDPKYETEDVNGSIVRTFDGVPVLADQNTSSVNRAGSEESYN